MRSNLLGWTSPFSYIIQQKYKTSDLKFQITKPAIVSMRPFEDTLSKDGNCFTYYPDCRWILTLCCNTSGCLQQEPINIGQIGPSYPVLNPPDPGVARTWKPSEPSPGHAHYLPGSQDVAAVQPFFGFRNELSYFGVNK